MIGETGTCMGCGRRRERALVEVTTVSDLEPVYVDGSWEGCCGWPVQRMASPRRRPYRDPWGDVWIGPSAPYPKVPTPEDLLHAAGLSVGWP